jgi:hypothetical protein
MPAELSVVQERGVRMAEGAADRPFVATARDASKIVEGCFAAATRRALLYPANLPPGFFDVSSGDAGAILQKLRTYRVRLAVVCPPGTVTFSSRFADLMNAERRDGCFAVFESRDAAIAWLAGQ